MCFRDMSDYMCDKQNLRSLKFYCKRVDDPLPCRRIYQKECFHCRHLVLELETFIG